MAQIQVALIGLGTMGSGMATNVLKAAFPLAVYNRTGAKAERFAAQGARIANTTADAVRGAQVIIAMLADDEASRAAWNGSDGALAMAEPGAVLVEASTLSPEWIAELSALASAKGLELLDAPVTGSRSQAEAGQLSFLVGGSEAALSKAKPVLEALSKEIVHLGPSGSGATMKLVNNFLCGVQVASLAEAIAWLEHSGLDRDKALNILKNGAPGSPLLSAISARMTSRNYDVNFLLKLMAKDLAYAYTAAAASGVDLRTAANAHQLFERAIADGHSEEDMASVVEVFRNSGAARWQ
jgi:3-hydroxyisobutyrate dehydrogenase